MKEFNASGFKAGGGLEEGKKYLFEIVNPREGESKGGDYMVTVDCAVVEGPEKGSKILFHNVVFKEKNSDGTWPKGAGFAIHFLHCISEPCNCDKCVTAGRAPKKMVVDPQKWIGKRFFGTTKAGNRGYPVIGKVESSNVKSATETPEEDEVPF